MFKLVIWCLRCYQETETVDQIYQQQYLILSCQVKNAVLGFAIVIQNRENISLNHLTGKTAPRLPGEEAQYDVFISYRVASDAVHAELLYNILSSAGFNVSIVADSSGLSKQTKHFRP
jgi:hypothetical protein